MAAFVDDPVGYSGSSTVAANFEKDVCEASRSIALDRNATPSIRSSAFSPRSPTLNGILTGLNLCALWVTLR